MISHKAFLGVIVAAIAFVLFFVGRALEHKSDSLVKDQVLEEKLADIQALKTLNGHLRYEKDAAELDKKSAEKYYKAALDSIKEWHDVKVKNLERALAISQETRGEGTGRIDTVEVPVPGYPDSVIVASKFGVQETFFTFDGIIYPSGDLSYSYAIFDSLSIVNHRKKVGLFRAPENKVSVYNKNPKTTITGITSITIKERPPKWVIGIGGGFGYGQGLGPQVGIYVVKPILTIR